MVRTSPCVLMCSGAPVCMILWCKEWVLRMFYGEIASWQKSHHSEFTFFSLYQKCAKRGLTCHLLFGLYFTK